MDVSTWARGSSSYADHLGRDRDHPRVVVTVGVGSAGLLTRVIVDTGAPWNVLDPELAAHAGLIPSPDDPRCRLVVRGDSVDGHLVRGALILKAEAGDDLEIEGTFFVPVLAAHESWPHPSFLGYSGALERMRFAVDPATRRFHFGAVQGR